MKKYLLLFILIVEGFSSQAQTSVYHPFPDSGAVWRINYQSNQPFVMLWKYQYVLKSDTFIDGYTYMQIYLEGAVHVNNGYVAALRDDTAEKKIYIILKDSINEKLLYNFSLNIGDTLHGLFLEASCSTAALIVQSIDSIFINNSYRKRINFPNDAYTENQSIIEGIGSNRGLLEGYFFHSDCDWHDLVCFKINDSIYYPDTATSYSCDLTTNNFEYKQENNSINIFPNPASEKVFISFIPGNYSDEINIKCFAILGQNVKINFVRQLNNIVVDVSSLYSGTYILSFFDKNNLLKNEKLIIISSN